MIELLLISYAALLIGPITFSLAKRHDHLMQFLDAFALFSIAAILVFHVIPDSLESGGLHAAAACAFGLLAPFALSKLMHQDECQIPRTIALLALIGLMAHALLDGMALSHSHMHQEQPAMMLALAVIVHRVPEGAGIWRLISNRIGKIGAWLFLGSAMVSTFVGFLFGHALLQHASKPILVVFQAFMAGVFMHLLFHRHHLPGHSHSHSHLFKSPAFLIGAGVGILFFTLVFNSDLSHMLHEH